MYAIVEHKGNQWKVAKGEKVKADSLSLKKGDILTIDKVLLISDNEKVKVGQPYVENAKVTCEVLREVKGKKIIVLTYKKVKNVRRTIGHRSKYTEILIKEIEG